MFMYEIHIDYPAKVVQLTYDIFHVYDDMKV